MTKHYLNFDLNNISENIDGVVVIEEWRSVVGYEGVYLVSNFGRIKSVSREDNIKHFHPEKIIKSFSSYEYRRVCLSLNGTQVKHQVHRLVGAAFIPNPEKKPEINHKYGVRWDNRVCMLEWGTSSENHKHAFKVLKKKPNKPWLGKATGISKKVICVDTGVVFRSAIEASKNLNISPGIVRKICNGRSYNGINIKYI